jgi:hypothetical protein
MLQADRGDAGTVNQSAADATASREVVANVQAIWTFMA